jgi:pSer/pThr/pTyr-binding forkhead associated (FHA) protein
MTGAHLLLAVRIALVLALYGFLSLAFWLVWQELRQSSALLKAPLIPQLTLTTFGDGAETVYRYAIPQVTLGRDPACDCRLDDRTISGLHARLSYHDNQWWLEDASSTNGTFINEERVTSAVAIITGDLVRFGQRSLRVSIGTQEPKGLGDL